MHDCEGLSRDEMFVTVLMPVFNKGPYISRALDSILAQEVDFEYEILIIDDASTDNSVKIVQEYINKYPGKIKFIQNKRNLGTFSTVVKGYELIKTKYWTVLDPDDYWLGTTRMQSAIDYLELHSDFTIYASNTYVDDGSGKKTPMFDLKNADYSFSSIDSEHFYLAHTSGSFFRNIFIQDELNKIKKYVGTKSEHVFRADAFRNAYHLSKGKARYESKIESVYCILKSGIWSRKNDLEKEVLNLRILYELFFYFNQERADLFLSRGCWYHVNRMFFNHQKELKLIAKSHYIDDMLDLVEQVVKCRNKLGLPNVSKSFCFYLPSHAADEYTDLFVSLSKYLSEELDFDVYYVDYEDGVVITELKDSKVKAIVYRNGMDIIEQDIPFNIILPATLAFQMPKFENLSSKFIFLFESPKSVYQFMMRVGITKEQASLFLMLECIVWVFDVVEEF